MVEFITMAPTSGDGEYVGNTGGGTSKLEGWTASAEREPSLAYITEIAIAAEKNGFGTLLLPTGSNCLDSLVIAATLVPKTETLKFLFAVRPGFTAPTVFAKQFASLDYLSGGRALINVVTGGSPAEQASDGDFLDHGARYRRTDEFIQVVKRLFTEEKFDHEGEFYQLKAASLFPKPVQAEPQIYIGGASEAGIQVAASVADVYMMWGETTDFIRERIEEVKAAVSEHNRKLSYSISFQVILGDTEEQAWANAQKTISKADHIAISGKEQANIKGDSVGLKRLHQLMVDSKAQDFRIGPNLWAGLTQVLSGNSIALVGTPDQVADRIIEYIQLGFDKVLLRGFPHLETIGAIGSEIIPRVRARLAALEL
ncbi:LLM class flavin-dependent oxidoreductase [Paenibacillus psychroresistens]|uniref:LLM class flavin-dependent oxidoreductase n=1 Tax=Paenibacillus psychroresistens TaxID=1778678 RepID=A0A6B8RG31_9BACL|nr:LLM class flavin-dependent oxidoreductase [Paenibacillus psychroresistens]QGQ95069.1 LLM class flavin-dependent oxidoreductase [Paenibacillus psychroresistens]